MIIFVVRDDERHIFGIYSTRELAESESQAKSIKEMMNFSISEWEVDQNF